MEVNELNYEHSRIMGDRIKYELANLKIQFKYHQKQAEKTLYKIQVIEQEMLNISSPPRRIPRILK